MSVLEGHGAQMRMRARFLARVGSTLLGDRAFLAQILFLSLLSKSLGWSQTCYIPKTGLEPLILLPPPPQGCPTSYFYGDARWGSQNEMAQRHDA